MRFSTRKPLFIFDFAKRSVSRQRGMARADLHRAFRRRMCKPVFVGDDDLLRSRLATGTPAPITVEVSTNPDSSPSSLPLVGRWRSRHRPHHASLSAWQGHGQPFRMVGYFNFNSAPCAFYLFIRAPRTCSVSGLPGPCLHDFVVCSRSALGTSANTNTKLLIYDLFQKGRVLAQDGIETSAILHFCSALTMRELCLQNSGSNSSTRTGYAAATNTSWRKHQGTSS